MLSTRDTASEIFRAALASVDPYGAVMNQHAVLEGLLAARTQGRTLVIGFGKAACPMAKAAEAILESLPYEGVVITKYGHCARDDRAPRKVRVFEGGHPVPDENGARGTRDLIDLLRGADETTLVLCLISGGGSALLCYPLEGITLEEKQKTTQLLLRAGADIFELNSVRKHLSSVKGGRLAQLAYPAKVVSLILSDVMGDKLDVIASGPTAPDTSSFHDALGVLDKYRLRPDVPGSVREALEKGSAGEIPETPKAGSPFFNRVQNLIIASNIIALETARRKAESLGYRAEILTSEMSGEAREMGRWLARHALERKTSLGQAGKLCLISGGETTVTVRGNGIGGRNMELALGFADEIRGRDGVALLSAGTDGTDGPTDAAGAIVDGSTVAEAERRGINLREYLENNDSYRYLERSGGLLVTGPTGTNVMDIQIVILD